MAAKYLNNLKNRGKAQLATPVEFSVGFCLIKHDRKKTDFCGWLRDPRQVKKNMKTMSGKTAETT
jgi:hypothetical protein